MIFKKRDGIRAKDIFDAASRSVLCYAAQVWELPIIGATAKVFN